MFRAFFGCTSLPFDRSISVENLFLSEAHEELVSRMVYAAETRKFALCTGEVGAGKSTAARAATERLNPTRFLVLYISDSDLTPRNFYCEVLHQLGIRARFYRGDAKRQLEKALLNLFEGNRTPVIIIDEAHLLGKDMLEEIRFLMNFKMDSFSPLSLILIGQSELKLTLQTQACEAIAQRINVRFHLTAMNESETAAYVKHHLRVAGVQREVFTDGALHIIHEYSGGIARKINNLCTSCLLHAFAKSKSLVDDHMVRVVLENEFLN
jgi:general secretion pathway protein A